MRKKVSISWSGGKDSAFALYQVLEENELEVVSLHTSLSEEHKRVGMHGTPEALVEAQASRIGLPLHKISIPADSSNESYETAMLRYYQQQKEAGLEGVVFGDIFLEDLKTYRETLLHKAGLKAYFPLWGKNTLQLINDFIQAGFKTTVCAANGHFFEENAVGTLVDKTFINSLPPGVDPCGEQGEFHTFVHAGPLFTIPLKFRQEGVVCKAYSLGKDAKEEVRFWFADLKPD